VTVRGRAKRQTALVTLICLEDRVPRNHPLRPIKKLADSVLRDLSATFDAMYRKLGRPSVPPERMLKASLLMALYTIRSERQFCEQLEYNLLFRWFLDMELDEPAFDHSTLSHNRARLLEHEVAQKFFAGAVEQADARGLLSNEHFSVDGTLIEAWASLKSLRPIEEDQDDRDPPDDPGNPSVDFRGQRRRNDTHRSTTDPEARLARKSLMDHRHGLLVDFQITQAHGTAERQTALSMLARQARSRGTVAGDRGFDTAGFVEECRALGFTPHVAQNHNRPGGSAIDQRTTRHPGYAMSQWIRKRIEEIFGWIKTVGNFRRTRYRGRRKNQHIAYLIGAAFNFLRLAKLVSESP
jgi:transposase